MKKRLIVPTFIASLALITGVFSVSVQSKTAKKAYAVGDIMEDGGHYAFDIEPEIQGVYAHKFLVPTDSYYSTQKSRSMSILGDIESVWDEYKGKGTTIAVIDDGFDHDHAEYKRKDDTSAILSTSRYYYASGSSAAYKEYSEDSTCLDEDWNSDESEWDTHGTNTSTTAAAPMGNGGVVGIAPEADILALKIDMSFAAIKGAISYAISQGVDVINMSLGAYAQSFTDGFNESQSGSSSVSTYLNQVCTQAYNAGIIVVAAAGNEATSYKSYPACNSHVIGVGALAKNSATTLAAFTNFNQSETQGDEKNVDILAPGFVYTAGITGTQSKHNATWHDTQGTSFASPIVAGAACLWKEKYPNGTPAEFEAALTSTAAGIGTYKDAKVNPATYYNNSKYQNNLDSNISCGRLDVKALLSDEITNITFTKDSYTVAPNSEGSCDESFPYSITPSFADKTEILFESSNDDILMVGENYWISGEEGTVTLTATSKKNSSVYDTCTVNVSSSGGEESDDDGITGTFTFGSTGRDISDSTAVTKNGITVQVGKNNGFNTSNVKLAQSNGDFTVTSANANIASVEITDDSGLYGFTVSTGSISVGSWTPPTGGTKSVKFTKSSGKQSTVSKIDVKLEQSSTPTNYTVSFNSNGGTGSMTNATTNGSSYTVPACTFTRTNYTFNKWALGSASGTQYSVGETITDISSNITLYALWTENQSTGGDDDGELSISENAATSITNNARYVWGTTNTNCINRVDSNWGYLSNTTSEFIIFTAETTDGGFYLKTSDGYIYSSADKKIAIDASSKTKLNLNADNTVTGGSSIGTYYVNTNIRPYKSNNSYGSAYLFPVTGGGGGDTPVTQNYTVSFEANGGTGSMANATTNGSSYVTPACSFTYSGYTFDKWALNSTTGTKYAAGATITGISSNITLYATWTENQSTGGDAGTYYDGITATSGTPLLGALHDLSVEKHTNYNSYSSDINTTNIFKTDPYSSSNTVVRDFYSGAPAKNEVAASENNGWNREHVWPQDLSNNLYGTSGPGADIQHIRPTIPKLNSDRGNKKYGELNNLGTASTTTDYNSNIVTGGYYTSSVFQPIASKKGDVARIIMYMYMHYNKAANIGETKDGSTSSYFGTLNFTHVISATNEAAAKQLLLTWNESDPVDSTETIRNTEAAKITGCRNPFIDHPEYANAIWGTVTPTKTLSSIAVSNPKTSYTVGDSFVAPTVTATYSDGSNAPVTATFSGYNMNSVGTQTVTVSYTEGGVTETATYEITVSAATVAVTGVSLNPTSLILSIGEDATLTATVAPSNASNKNVTWESSNNAVARVNNGTITAVSAGNATITVKTVDGNKTATCAVTVKSSGSTVGDTDTITINRSSFSATSGAYDWYTWSQDGLSGSARIYATTTNGMQFSGDSNRGGKAIFASTNTTGKYIDTVSVKTNSSTAKKWTLYVSDTAYTTSTTTSGTNVGQKSLTSTAQTWTVNGDYSYFSLDLNESNSSTLTEIVVTLKSGGVSPTPTPEVHSISIVSTLSINMDNSSTGAINATVDADAGASYSVTWSSSDTTTATVSGNNTSATVTALKAGTATITARISDAIYSTCTVSITKSEVVPPTPSGEYTLLTDASVLKAGDQIVIANSANGVTATDLGTNTYLGRVTSTFSSDKSKITSLGNGTVEFTLGGSDSAWTLSNGTQNLGATAQGKLAWGSGTTTWSISISDGQATIQNGTSTYGRFLYNVGSPRFTTYTSNVSATMVMPQIYYKSSGVTPTPDKEITSIELQAEVTTVLFGEGKGSYDVPAKLIATYDDKSTGEITPTSTNYEINTKVLGNHKISAVYDSVSYYANVKVTNVGATANVGETTTGTAKTETISASNLKATTTSYTAFSNVSIDNGTGAVYAGSSAKDSSGNIQLRSSSSNTGIIQTTSGGKVTKIKITVSSGSNTINIYGKDEAYSSVGDLYNTSKQGTLIGSLSGTNTIEFTSDKQFDYIGIRSSSGAVYISSIEVTCASGSVSFNATSSEQAQAWANYFKSLTRTDTTCLASDDATKLAGLKEVWSELKTEYEAMVAGSKDSFCSDSENAEILKHYQYIISKFGKSSKYGNDGLEDFVKDSKDNKPVVNSNAGLLNISNKLEPATIVTATVAVAGVVAIGLYFGIKKRKEI